MDKTYFDRDSADVRTSSFGIFVNQAGYKIKGSKIAAAPFECGNFEVRDENGAVVFKGKPLHFGFDKNSGDDVYIFDFSALEKEGGYRIYADGRQSAAFEISDRVFEKLTDDVLRAFYFLRCGSGLCEKHAGVYAHGKCHNEKAVLWSDNSVSAEIEGGWHDAGDYGRYVTAGACALAHLLYAFKLYPKAFEKRSLDIPESGNGVPDILNECRYELEWLLKMQRSDGGVYHKATTFTHAPFVMPEEDKAQLYLFDVSSMAVADAAAVFALAGGVFADYDKAFSQRLISAAELSYSWLENNPGFVGFSNPEGCNTGSYGEHEDKSNRFWAACEMFSLTGNEKYYSRLLNLMDGSFSLYGLGCGDIGGLGSLSCLLSGRIDGTELYGKLVSAFSGAAGECKKIADECGYGAAMKEEFYVWGSNMILLKNGMIFAISDYLSGGSEYRSYVTRQLDCLLGLNALGISYVTGSGEFRCNYPHLRPAYADGIEECIPGMVSGGPNRSPCDHDAKILIPQGTPPMKCFADDFGCYSLNEITIYWNSPAVFLLGYLFG